MYIILWHILHSHFCILPDDIVGNHNSHALGVVLGVCGLGLANLASDAHWS